MMTEIETIPLTAQTAQEFRIPPHFAPHYDLIRVTASDYDEGGNNSVVMCFPCPTSTPMWADEVVAAVATCKENTMKALSFQLERTRKNEKFFAHLERLVRREFRYFLSVNGIGKNIPEIGS